MRELKEAGGAVQGKSLVEDLVKQCSDKALLTLRASSIIALHTGRKYDIPLCNQHCAGEFMLIADNILFKLWSLLHVVLTLYTLTTQNMRLEAKLVSVWRIPLQETQQQCCVCTSCGLHSSRQLASWPNHPASVSDYLPHPGISLDST